MRRSRALRVALLALAADPVADPRDLRSICVAVKQGHRLAIEPAAACD